MSLDPLAARSVSNDITVDRLTRLAMDVHAGNVAAGWWTDLKTGADILETRNVPEMLCLIHSEISEAMEGYRGNLPDDHLPQYPMMLVELADAVIRILDLAGSRMAIAERNGEPVHRFGEIFVAKRNYNRERADHKAENRLKDGGKAF